MNLIEVEAAIVKWSADRGILANGSAQTQCLKLMSELGELADNLAKGKDVTDDIGDCFVVLTNIARLAGTTLEECANLAYEEIKDRKGFLNENGTFIKESDSCYTEKYAEWQKSREEKEFVKAMENARYTLRKTADGWIGIKRGNKK